MSFDIPFFCAMIIYYWIVILFMKTIELDKTDVFHCPASFGTLSQEQVNKLFTDGRRASGFLEIQLEEWYDGLGI